MINTRAPDGANNQYSRHQLESKTKCDPEACASIIYHLSGVTFDAADFSAKLYKVPMCETPLFPKKSNQDLWSISNYLGITAGQPTHGFVGITQIRRKQQYCKYSSSVNHDRTRVNGGCTLTRLETAYFDVRSFGALALELWLETRNCVL